MDDNTKQILDKIETIYGSGTFDSVSGERIFNACPSCGESHKFYLNVYKGTGLCFRATCDYSDGVSLQKLLTTSRFNLTKKRPIKPENLAIEPIPKDSDSILRVAYPLNMKAMYLVRNLEAFKYLKNRKLSNLAILKYNIKYSASNDRVIVPLFNYTLNSTLRSAIRGNYAGFISRTLKNKSYLYGKNSRHKDIVFSAFVESTTSIPRSQTFIVVENTFVCLALYSFLWTLRYRYLLQDIPPLAKIQFAKEDLVPCTLFGSSMSDEQLLQFKYSCSKGGRKILFVWDEGAEQKAYKAVQRLRKLGIRAQSMEITGQPDDYDYLDLILGIAKIKDNSTQRINFRKDSQNYWESVREINSGSTNELQSSRRR